MSDMRLEERDALRRMPSSTPTACAYDRSWAPAIGPLELPAEPAGELWLVEIPPSEPELAPLEYRTLRTSDVVIYDRALARVVTSHLPVAGYAEAAASNCGISLSECDRYVRLVRDGWRVARLFYPGHASNRERLGIGQLRRSLLALGCPTDLSVRLFVSDGAAVYERHEALLHRLDEIVAEYGSLRSLALTIAFDVTQTGWPSRFSVASTNGLAG
jgi:hypothetical protein